MSELLDNGRLFRLDGSDLRALCGGQCSLPSASDVSSIRRLSTYGSHLDAPWKPAEVEQREGRILRQGNENEERLTGASPIGRIAA